MPFDRVRTLDVRLAALQIRDVPIPERAVQPSRGSTRLMGYVVVRTTDDQASAGSQIRYYRP